MVWYTPTSWLVTLPVQFQDAPRPSLRPSSSATCTPAALSMAAQAAPVSPPPTMATSAFTKPRKLGCSCRMPGSHRGKSSMMLTSEGVCAGGGGNMQKTQFLVSFWQKKRPYFPAQMRVGALRLKGKYGQ